MKVIPKQLMAAVLAAAALGAQPVAMVVGDYFEGNRLQAYADTGGVWTICKGSTKGVKPGDVATADECEERHQQDMQVTVAGVDAVLTAELPTLCRAAHYDFAYNVGLGNYRRSTLLRKFNSGDPYGGAAEFSRWIYVAGKDCRLSGSNCAGIVTRRDVERYLCEVSL